MAKIVVKSTFSLTFLAVVLALLSLPASAQWISSRNAPQGGAAGTTAHDAMPDLEYCDAPLGTVAVIEEQEGDWYHYLTNDLRLPSTVPVIRMLIQQSNCFVVVERGRAMRSMEQERALMARGELRKGSNFGKRQMVAADYTINPVINFSKRDAGGLSGLIRDVGKGFGHLASLAGGLRLHRAETMLVMIDSRSGVQLGIAQGRATKVNFDFNAIGRSDSSFGALGGYSSTPEGKVLTVSFANAYNHLVRAMRGYKAQEVEGGLGKGGRLKRGA